MFTHRLMRAADETLLWNEQQNDFYHFYFFLLRHEPAGGSLGFESLSCFWFFFARSQIWNCVLCLCVSDTVCSSSCAAGFIVLCITFQQRGPSCYDFVSLLGDIFSFLFFFPLVFFFAGSLSQNSNETNQKRQQTECWSLSQQLHTAHSCHADFRNHCFTPSLWIHIYTFFFFISFSPARVQNKPQTTSFTRWARLLRLNSPDRLTS